MIVQGILEEFVWVNSAQVHRNHALQDPVSEALRKIIFYSVTNKNLYDDVSMARMGAICS